jgi:carbonic anhydrase/acetyltransferase-like protein (isoleucine patch superfamily)
MSATILNGARVGEGSIVAAGALVPEGKEFPPRSLIIGAPSKRVKEVSEEQTRDIQRGVRTYVERAAKHWEAQRYNS